MVSSYSKLLKPDEHIRRQFSLPQICNHYFEPVSQPTTAPIRTDTTRTGQNDTAK